MHGQREDSFVIFENSRGAVALVHVQVQNQNPVDFDCFLEKCQSRVAPSSLHGKQCVCAVCSSC